MNMKNKDKKRIKLIKRQKKSKLTIKSIIFMIAVIFIVIGLTKICYLVKESYSIYDVKTLNATFIIENKIGLAADTNVLNFGMSPPGGSSTKEILLYHEYKERLKIKLVYAGNIAQLLEPIKPFYLEPKTEKKLGITAYAVQKPGNYSGTVKIYYLKQ